jgi:hypothetical protein
MSVLSLDRRGIDSVILGMQPASNCAMAPSAGIVMQSATACAKMAADHQGFGQSDPYPS